MAKYPSGVSYRGINRIGGEFLDEWDGWKDQLYYDIPDTARLTGELNYFADIGFNTIRFPISWERLQHTLQQPLDAPYTKQVTAFVEQATATGWLVTVDLHNYNRYATGAFDSTGKMTPVGVFTQHVFGDGTLGVAALVDVWTRLASLFVGNSNVAFGLMNEPHDFPVPSDIWFACLQQVIYAIRGTGADQLILVPNSRGSDVSHWKDNPPNGGPLDSEAALAITDTSVNNYAFDMHAYHDSGAGSSYSKEVSVVTGWARDNGKKLFLSELGVEKDDLNGAAALTDLFTYLNANADVWLGWAPWDDADPDPTKPYTLTLEDLAGNRIDGPQMPWYKPHLTPNTV